jgi:hypothetical protein
MGTGDLAQRTEICFQKFPLHKIKNIFTQCSIPLLHGCPTFSVKKGHHKENDVND